MTIEELQNRHQTLDTLANARNLIRFENDRRDRIGFWTLCNAMDHVLFGRHLSPEQEQWSQIRKAYLNKKKVILPPR